LGSEMERDIEIEKLVARLWCLLICLFALEGQRSRVGHCQLNLHVHAVAFHRGIILKVCIDISVINTTGSPLQRDHL
jgi:hypothetical protein